MNKPLLQELLALGAADPDVLTAVDYVVLVDTSKGVHFIFNGASEKLISLMSDGMKDLFDIRAEFFVATSASPSDNPPPQ